MIKKKRKNTKTKQKTKRKQGKTEIWTKEEGEEVKRRK